MMFLYARSLRWYGLLCLVVAMLLLTGPSAYAQGTSGTLPDPITSSELNEYAERLGLSSDQRRAMGQFYEQYHQRFRELRDGEIAEFLRSMQGMNRGMQMPPRDELEQLQKDWDRVRSRIRTLDDSFFADIQVLLTDQQRRELPRVQMARERHRLQANMMAFMGGRAFDLSSELLDMDLSPQEFERVDPILADYELRLTRAMQKSHEASQSMMTDMHDAMTDLGYDEDSFENADDPEAMQEMMEAIQTAMREIWKRMNEAQITLQEVNLRTYRNVMPLLEESTKRSFRRTFFSRGFPMLGIVAPEIHLDRFDIALSLEELDADIRRSLESSRAELLEAEERWYRDLLNYVENHAPSPFSFLLGDQGSQDEQQEIQQELNQRSRELVEKAQKSFRDLIPSEQQEKVHAAEALRSEQESAAQPPRRTLQPEESSTSTSRSSGDPYVPGRMTRRTMTVIADELDFNDEFRAWLDERFEAYVAEFEQAVAPLLQEINQKRSELWQHDPDSGSSRHGGAEVTQALFALRQQAREQLAALDLAFFDDLYDALPDDDQFKDRLERAERGRERERNMDVLRGGTFSRSQFIDLSRLARTNSELRRHIDLIDDEITAWDEAVGPILTELADRRMRFSEISEILTAEMPDMSSGEFDMAAWQEYNERRQERLGSLQGELRELNADIRRETARSRDAIADRLPEAAAREFIDLFNRRAHADVFRDQTAMHDHLEQAFELPDLADRQRSELAELSMEYRAAYRQLLDEMIDLANRSSDYDVELLDEDDIPEYMNVQSQRQRLQFERNELNARVIRELEALLTETQIQRLGGLPEPEQARNPWSW
ncbi:MAG: hypothetical protein EA377_10040 [Phycisphaerales bacterium]|nr:MAG: hypothetical protein EA377_10040 [Phycisphaerales bacterium]